MEYKLKFENGRSCEIYCESDGKPLQDKINAAEERYGSPVKTINGKEVAEHGLGGFLVGAIIGGIAGNMVAKQGLKKTVKSVAKKTTSIAKKTTSVAKKAIDSVKKKEAPKSKRSNYVPNRLIDSIETKSGKKIDNKDIIDGTHTKKDILVSKKRVSSTPKDIDKEKALKLQTDYLSAREIKVVNTTYGRKIKGSEIIDGTYVKKGVFADGGRVPSEEVYKRVFDYIIGGDRPKSFETLKSQVDAEAKSVNASVSEIYKDMQHDMSGAEDYHYMKNGGSVSNSNPGEANRKYLNSISDTEKTKILQNIAKHYGINNSEVEEEVLDAEAEMLYEYIANDQRLRMQVYEDMKKSKYEGGGVVTYVDSNDSTKNYFFKRYAGAIGSFAWMFNGRYIEGILYPIDSFDKKYYSHLKLKSGEQLYRFSTERFSNSDRYQIKPFSENKFLIKLNLDKGMIYFMSDDNDEHDDRNVKFDSKGTKAEYIVIDKSKFKSGGSVRKEYSSEILSDIDENWNDNVNRILENPIFDDYKKIETDYYGYDVLCTLIHLKNNHVVIINWDGNSINYSYLPYKSLSTFKKGKYDKEYDEEISFFDIEENSPNYKKRYYWLGNGFGSEMQNFFKNMEAKKFADGGFVPNGYVVIIADNNRLEFPAKYAMDSKLNKEVLEDIDFEGSADYNKLYQFLSKEFDAWLETSRDYEDMYYGDGDQPAEFNKSGAIWGAIHDVIYEDFVDKKREGKQAVINLDKYESDFITAFEYKKGGKLKYKNGGTTKKTVEYSMMYFDPDFKKMSYDEKVNLEKERLASAGIEIGDIVMNSSGMAGVVTLFSEKQTKKLDSPIMVKLDKPSSEVYGWGYHAISGFYQYLPKAFNKKFKILEDGGMIDLFETPDQIPSNVMSILEEYSEGIEDGDYQEIQNALSEIELEGYTFDYYVDGSVSNLRPINSTDEYSDGGSVEEEKFYFTDENPISKRFGHVYVVEKGHKPGTWDVTRIGQKSHEKMANYLDTKEEAIEIAKNMSMGNYKIPNTGMIKKLQNTMLGWFSFKAPNAANKMGVEQIRQKAIQYYKENGDRPYSEKELDRILALIDSEKYAQGGLTEHGLRVQDKITGTYDKDKDFIFVIDGENNSHIVNLDKGERFGNGGMTSENYKIVKGQDHYNNKPLFQVVGIENDYVGEWHSTMASAQNELKSMNSSKYASGGIVGQDVTFNHWSGDIRKGTITEQLGDGQYAVSSGFGSVLVNPDDIISVTAPKPEKKFLGIFEEGGSVESSFKNGGGVDKYSYWVLNEKTDEMYFKSPDKTLSSRKFEEFREIYPKEKISLYKVTAQKDGSSLTKRLRTTWPEKKPENPNKKFNGPDIEKKILALKRKGFIVKKLRSEPNGTYYYKIQKPENQNNDIGTGIGYSIDSMGNDSFFHNSHGKNDNKIGNVWYHQGDGPGPRGWYTFNQDYIEDLIRKISVSNKFEEGGSVDSKRYKVTIYHGGEQPNQVFYASSLDEARELSFQGEHSEIVDTKSNTLVYENGGTPNSGLSWHLDRKRHNKSEKYEKPLSARKRKYAYGGSIEFSEDDQEGFDYWIEDGNVIKNSDGTYSTQDAQYRNKLTLDELKRYFVKEYLSDSDYLNPRVESNLLTDEENDTLNEELESFENLIDYKDINTFTSGGNMYHTMILLDNGHILTINWDSKDVQYSLETYPSIEEYAFSEDGDSGWDKEYYTENSESRMSNLNDESLYSFLYRLVD